MSRSVQHNCMCDKCNQIKPDVVWSGPGEMPEVIAICYDCRRVKPGMEKRYEDLLHELEYLSYGSVIPEEEENKTYEELQEAIDTCTYAACPNCDGNKEHIELLCHRCTKELTGQWL